RLSAATQISGFAMNRSPVANTVNSTSCRLIPWAGVFLCLIVAGQLHPRATAGELISLAGEWRFQLDRENVGTNESWQNRQLTERVQLPGCLPAQGIGDDITTATPWMGDIKYHQWFKDPLYAKHAQPGNIHFPFWLQPDKYYAGSAWYQRD